MRPLDKLDYKKIGLFKILDLIGIVNYKLDLLENIRINPVFHALLLKLVPLNAETFVLELNEEVNEIVKYEVERILEKTI